MKRNVRYALIVEAQTLVLKRGKASARNVD